MMTPVALMTGRNDGSKTAAARPSTLSTSWSSVGVSLPPAIASRADSIACRTMTVAIPDSPPFASARTRSSERRRSTEGSER